MIQEKDFLYRVPVKTAPITTPRGQIRNPEILVDLEGGEFMHGNILDANSTNKLINQSVKDAVDDKFNESGHVTKDLLDAETSARTKGDEALGAKIKAEQTRAEGKEKEISDKLAIVDGDSNTEGSFRKAIADVSGQFAAKADRSDLMALEQKITANTTALEGKQNKGDYVTYSSEDYDNYYFHKGFVSSVPFTVDDGDGNKVKYGINGIVASTHQNCLATSDGTFKPISDFALKTELPTKTSQLTNDSNFIAANRISDAYIGLEKDLRIYSENIGGIMTISHSDIRLETDDRDFTINNNGFFISNDDDVEYICSFTPSGIRFAGKTDNNIPTANGGFIDIDNFASNEEISSLRVGLSKKQNTITVNEVDVTDIETADITKLRTIVTNLINALSASDLIRKTQALE